MVCSVLGFHIDITTLIITHDIVQNVRTNDCDRDYIIFLSLRKIMTVKIKAQFLNLTSRII